MIERGKTGGLVVALDEYAIEHADVQMHRCTDVRAPTGVLPTMQLSAARRWKYCAVTS